MASEIEHTKIPEDLRREIISYLDEEINAENINLYNLTLEGIGEAFDNKYSQKRIKSILSDLEEKDEVIGSHRYEIDVYYPIKHEDRLSRYNFFGIPKGILFQITLGLTIVMLIFPSFFTNDSVSVGGIIVGTWGLALWYHFLNKPTSRFIEKIILWSSSVGIDKKALTTILITSALLVVAYILIANYIINESIKSDVLVYIIATGITAGSIINKQVIKEGKK